MTVIKLMLEHPTKYIKNPEKAHPKYPVDHLCKLININ